MFLRGSISLAFLAATLLPCGAEPVTEHDVLPILLRRCGLCHGPQEEKEGGLDLRSRESILQGGESGPALVIGDAGASLLIEKIAADEMPPKDERGQGGIEAVTEDELATIREWIAAGAPESPPEKLAAKASAIEEKDRGHWAFVPPRRAASRNEKSAGIDFFLREKLKAKGIDFSPQADADTLVRRASFLLTGLPPSAEEMTAFQNEFATDPDAAFEKLVDRLLDSPRYGERWGRVWLDVAGYADSEGKRHADMIRANAWRYRDYVIRSLNADKPYDRFLLEQLAGDELADYEDTEITPEIYDNLVATGFLRMAPDGTTANPVNRPEDRLEVISDEMRVLTEGVMGLTMECARCHDHKYDPLSQRDYYGLLAIFKGAYDEYDWLIPQYFRNQSKRMSYRSLPHVLPEERAAFEEKLASIEARLEPLEKQLAGLDEKAKEERKKLDKEIKELEAKKPQQPMIRALWDRGRPTNTYVLNRGDHLQPIALVKPDVPGVFADLPEPYLVEPPPASSPGEKTGRRLAFAKWLTQPDHPLTARVIVNRVWQQHFGRGIVESVDNFGKLGSDPSHPELLDSLAAAFVENGWSLKWLQREIMNSRAWRQRSLVTKRHRKLDPDNRLLSRMPLRRLTAEEVRDSVLLLSGRLDETPYGKPDPVTVRKDGMVVTANFEKPETNLRRTIYLRHRRKEMPTILETFDQPAMNPNCVKRSESTIVTQPLHLLNNRMIHHLAKGFADRLETGDLGEKVRQAWVMALNESPSAGEVAGGVETVRALTGEWEKSLAEDGGNESAESLALADFCHTLINSAAFLYVD